MSRWLIIIVVLFAGLVSAQVHKNDTIRVENYPTDSVSTKSDKEVDVIADIEKSNAPAVKSKYSPTRAGLYSAVLPGLGQFYNKKYWKIPVVWGAVGTGVGITLWNQRQYKKYRNAFIAELNGLPHEFSDIRGVTKESLGRIQDRAKRQRDYAIAISGLIYILGIVDAVVDAHLYDQKHDPDLTLQPSVIYDEFGKTNTKAGLTLNFKF